MPHFGIESEVKDPFSNSFHKGKAVTNLGLRPRERGWGGGDSKWTKPTEG